MTIVHVAEGIMEETARLLTSFAAAAESEGVVYWFGLELGELAVVTTLIVPDADTSTGAVQTSAAVNAEAIGAVAGTPLVLLGQAHSHPSRWVGHSSVDDRDTFAQFPGALSVVVPYYGRHGMELASCGVHRHIEGTYRRIRDTDVEEHLRVLPGVRDMRDRTRPQGRRRSGWLERLRLVFKGGRNEDR
ncbi:MAG: hypothetical protein JWM95_1350 [Gemmatimonadetes bacterium]|nr:hypothetical protein [Gemmatimonadota bacterium]